METSQSILYNVTILVATTIFIYNAILLFFVRHKNKSNKVLAFTNLMWGTLFLTLVICQFLHIEITTYPVFSVKTLILSNLFICIMYLYPIQIVCPKKFNAKDLMQLFLPSIVISLLYFCILYFTKENVKDLRTFGELLGSLSEFNVWYRFIILGCNLFYSFSLLKIISARRNDNRKDTDGSKASRKAIEAPWLNYYFYMIIVLVAFYVLTIFWGSEWNIIIYNAVIICCFSILFYKGAFRNQMNRVKVITQETKEEKENEEEHEDGNKEESPNDENGEQHFENQNSILSDIRNYSFNNKIPFYVKAIQDWMENERPYLNPDFKLTDLSSILPLNRSYLSRIFNEGFKQSFSDVVRNYRIKYAQELITKHPQMTLHKVAELCGFTSYTTLTRAFHKNTGMSPKEFKSNLIFSYQIEHGQKKKEP